MRSRRHDRHAPKVDLRDRARQGEARQQPGAQQRGFAGAAGADDQQERRARRILVACLPQPLDRLRDGELAAEEDAAAIGFERRKTWKGRAVEHAVPHRALCQEAVPRQPLAQAILDLQREIICRRIVLECRQELAAAGPEPGVEESLQALPLRLDLRPVRRVERHRRGVRVAKHVNVRQVLAGLSRIDRRQHLIGRAARIGFARRHNRKPGREPGAEPGAKHGNDHVAVGGFGNLPLKGVVGGIVGGLPADRFDPTRPSNSVFSRSTTRSTRRRSSGTSPGEETKRRRTFPGNGCAPASACFPKAQRRSALRRHHEIDPPSLATETS